MTVSIIKKINPVEPETELIALASEILNAGKVVVAPTETKYGLLARADKMEPIEKIYLLKGRNLTNPMAIFVKGFRAIKELGVVNETASELADKFLPGPLTLVLKSKANDPGIIAGSGKIGFRISSSPVISGLLEAGDYFLTATSANISGDPEPKTVEEVVSVFENSVDLYLDGGRLDGLPSTVIDCSGDSHKILRVGAIPINAIERALSVN
jgi:L-threonylcarbamoyladenylate synthase